MERKEQAKAYFQQGYNCAQSVTMAFCDLWGQKPEDAARDMSAFGGGISRMREVCGAVSAVAYVVGKLQGYNDPKNPAEKKRVYDATQALCKAFERENGSVICRDLLAKVGIRDGDRTGRPCPELVASAAALLAEYLGV